MNRFSPPQKPILHTSYQISFQISKLNKPHTVGEELIKSCVVKMAINVLGKEAAKELQQVSLFYDIIHDRFVAMSEDILEQVVDDIKASPVKISLQVDESTDVSNCYELVVVGRYVKS